MKPDGQLPAYEWNFSDVNPPIHAWAAMQVYTIEKKLKGVGDIVFLKKVFQKLLINFTWWINRKDRNGNNIFEGGFLGLDNIGVFNRSLHFTGETKLEQADGTSWMGTYALDMMDIALEIAVHDNQDLTTDSLSVRMSAPKMKRRDLNSKAQGSDKLFCPTAMTERLPGPGFVKTLLAGLSGDEINSITVLNRFM